MIDYYGTITGYFRELINLANTWNFTEVYNFLILILAVVIQCGLTLLATEIIRKIIRAFAPI